jgi:hypothetical protein
VTKREADEIFYSKYHHHWRPTYSRYVRFEVFTAVSMKIAIFLDIKHCSYLTGIKLLLLYRAQPVNVV